MINTNTTIDLTAESSSQLQTAAFYQVKDLARGHSLTLLTAQDPALTMHSLNLQLRNNLRWKISREQDRWCVLVQRAEDVEASDVLDLLKRDHKRLDELFSHVIHATDLSDMTAATRYVGEFSKGMRLHLEVEKNLLAQAITAPRDPHGNDPTSAMLQEHEDILIQTLTIISCFEEKLTPNPGDVAPLLAILAGYLSKHEAREETLLFPLWQAALKKAPIEAQQNLLKRAQEILYGEQK